jgi:hypothetical protein
LKIEMMAMPDEKPRERTRPRQARELARRLGLLTEAQAAAGWGVIIILGALLGAIYLNQTSKIATIGRRVQQEQNDLDEIKRQNAELERLIAEAQSLERLDSEARRLGFVPSTPSDIDFIVIPNYPIEDMPEKTEEQPIEDQSAPPETIWEAIALSIREMGIDMTRGAANEQ